MKRGSLLSLLDAEGIDPGAYDLEGRAEDNCYVLDPFGGAWDVYFSERGERVEERRFATEDEACAHVVELLLRDSTTRL